MKTRHLVSLVTGILIVSVLVPICLSIWLAHRQARQAEVIEISLDAPAASDKQGGQA